MAAASTRSPATPPSPQPSRHYHEPAQHLSEHALKQALHSSHETALRDTGKDQTRLQKWIEDLTTLARVADAESE